MNILVVNCGSSTVKLQQWLAASPGQPATRLARCSMEGFGDQATVAFAAAGVPPAREIVPLPDIRAALEYFLSRTGGNGAIQAVGHRVVHGGERFTAPVLLNEEIAGDLEELARIAPLHNTANVAGIRAARDLLRPDVPQVAVFDTGFHATLPGQACLYAIPYELHQRFGIRRFGFHGISHRYMAERYAALRGIPQRAVNAVTLHLGNGCSACAIQGGRSMDTSMGFTPLEGLMMGTRSGDIDAGAVTYLAAAEGLDPAGVVDLLNKRSGLLGISGQSHDMRELTKRQAAGDHRASLAIEMFCYRARKYVGSYLAAMGGADAILFSGGIGENAAAIRTRICAGLEWAGLEVDPDANETLTGGAEGPFHKSGSRLGAYVIPTDEESVIARDTAGCVLGESSKGEAHE